MPFTSVPSNATLNPKSFEAHVPEEDLESFRTLLKLSRIGPKTYENTTADPKDLASFGIQREWLQHAQRHWQAAYDWRRTEERINALPNYAVQLSQDGNDFTLHFVALFSNKKDAVPLLLLHGWPGSFMEFLGVLEELKAKYDEDSLPFHVVVPSLPGYAYSSGPPLDHDFTLEGVVGVLDKLMLGLGFGDGYVAQGGDLGSFLARILGVRSASCKAVHLNLCTGVAPADENEVKQLKPHEQQGLQRAQNFANMGSAYAREHGTRPATIGLVLSSSPIALLAWIGEKFLQWTDSSPNLDEILDSVTLYWFTDSFPRCIYPYRQIFGLKPVPFHSSPEYHLAKPLGYSWHPRELAPTPVSFVAKTGNLVWHREHHEGGHFFAMEKPKQFVQDIEKFVKQVWPTAKGSKI